MDDGTLGGTTNVQAISPLTAMVIDDSRAMRIMLTRHLAGFGYSVEGAADGREAMARLSDGRCRHLAVVDWNMPEMNGLQFIEAVRADARFADMRLLVVTSETEMAQMVSALKAGADEYLMKPFTPESLADKLQLLGLGNAGS